MAQSPVMTGARAIVKNAASGKILVTCNSINYAQDYSRQAIDVLGNLLTQDHVITGVTVSGSMNGFRVPGQPPELQAGGLIPLVQQLLTEEAITISIEDRVTGQTIANILGVKINNWSENTDARSTDNWSANFVGIIIQRENAPNSERADSSSIFNP